MLTYISIFVTAIFVNNIVLSQFLGICPFLGVSKRIDSALGMGAAVTFVMTIATIVTYLLQTYLLMPMKLDYMQTIVFILVIAALVQLGAAVGSENHPHTKQNIRPRPQEQRERRVIRP